MKNMCCNKKTCGCNKTVNYCGSFLACSGIENGESFDEVVKKLNAVVCDYASAEYSFLDNEECENGGFVVKNADEEVVFSACYPCCGGGSLIFEENEECENGGFIVKNEEQETVFAYCSPPNCGSFYISNHIIDEVDFTDNITFNVEGGSGDYTFDFQHSLKPVFSFIEISYDENLGKIVVANIKGTVEIFFLVTVKDNVTGCVAQYPLYLITSR